MKDSIHKPETIEEAINDLQTFLIHDIWFASQEEWKKEDDAVNYIKEHFKILFNQIEEIKYRENIGSLDIDY